MSAVLSRPTLVLNRSWQPVRVSTVSRALILVWNGVARVVDPQDFSLYDWDDWSRLKPLDGEPFVRAVRQQFRVPEVVTLTHYDKLPVTHVAFSRRNLFKRDGYKCQYCGAHPRPDELTIDHIVPRSRGGESTWENCVLACMECNKRKADGTPDEKGLRLKSRPVRPRWKPLYASSQMPIASWAKFISEAYWTVELER